MKQVKLFSPDKIDMYANIIGLFDVYSCPFPHRVSPYIKPGKGIQVEVRDQQCKVIDEYKFISENVNAQYNQKIVLYKKTQTDKIFISFPQLQYGQPRTTTTPTSGNLPTQCPVSSDTL